MSDKEKKVFSQELNRDDLRAVAGGSFADGGPCDSKECGETQKADCIKHNKRDIYGGKGFPNCASVVNDGSWCENNDACFEKAVSYTGINRCTSQYCFKAWQ